MIKLITQFDNEKSRMSLATPTCGCCCCCCCCCIVSTFAAASISARSFGNYVNEQLPNEPQKAKTARKFGFLFPIGLVGCLIISFLFLSEFYLNVPTSMIIITVAYLSIVTFLLTRKINFPGIFLRVFGLLAILIGFEIMGLWVGLFALVLLTPTFYLIVALIISILLVILTFRNDWGILGDSNVSKTFKKKISDVKTDELEQQKTHSIVEVQKKKCQHCGTENVIDNKICIYCSEPFEEVDKK